jgi:RNA 2',3'-cyclic 3'-phosphodiesterase
MADRWRLFVAVPIDDELRAALAASVADWRGRPDLAGIRWTEPEAWHLTLLFLGATDPGEVTAIVRTLEHVVAGHEPMALATGGLGGFSSAGRARVAWYGVDDPERRLRRLADDVRAALAPDESSRFRAHVTLGRAKSDPVDLRAWIADARPPQGSLRVDDLVLMRSHLGRGPARYEALATAPLGALVRG